MWNSKLDVYRTEWLDLVFANRNKSYGAYELRLHNSRTTIKAFLTASSLMISVIMVLFMFSGKKDQVHASILIPDREVIFQVSKIPNQTPVQAPLKVEKPASKPLIVKTKSLNLNVVPNNMVIEEPVTIAELHTSQIGPASIDGAAASTSQTGIMNGSGSAGHSDGSTGNEVVSTVFLEKHPEFPGGEQAFAKYLSKNLRYPYAAVENGISGRVIVSFIIEKNGDLTDIKVLRGIGGGCDEEAVRVLKKAPSWSPGMQNGKAVRVAFTMPIHFQLGN